MERRHTRRSSRREGVFHLDPRHRRASRSNPRPSDPEHTSAAAAARPSLPDPTAPTITPMRRAPSARAKAVWPNPAAPTNPEGRRLSPRKSHSAFTPFSCIECILGYGMLAIDLTRSRSAAAARWWRPPGSVPIRLGEGAPRPRGASAVLKSPPAAGLLAVRGGAAAPQNLGASVPDRGLPAAPGRRRSSAMGSIAGAVPS